MKHDFQIVIMTQDWAKFMFEDKETLVEAGALIGFTLIDDGRPYSCQLRAPACDAQEPAT